MHDQTILTNLVHVFILLINTKHVRNFVFILCLDISIIFLGPVTAVEIQPLLPPQSGEKQPEDSMRFFLDALLEFIVSQVNILGLYLKQCVY